MRFVQLSAAVRPLLPQELFAASFRSVTGLSKGEDGEGREWVGGSGSIGDD